MSRHAIEIIGAHPQNGKIPDGCQIKGFPGCTLIGGAVADKNDSDTILFLALFGGQCRTKSKNGVGAENAVGIVEI